jgi:hypothetical protein
MSIKDLVITSRRFLDAFITRANKGESGIRVWQIGPAVVAFPDDGPIAFCTTALSHRLEDRPLELRGQAVGAVATWEPAERTENDDKYRKMANHVLSQMHSEAPVSVNVNPRLLSEVLDLMEGDCVLDLIPSTDPAKADPWHVIRVRDGQSIAVVAAVSREGLVNTTGTWCDRYPRPNAARPEINPPDGWGCISDGDYPEDGDYCTVAFMDAHGEIRVCGGTWFEIAEDWIYGEGGSALFGDIPVDALPFPIYWIAKRLSESEAIAALTGQSEPEPF